MLTVAVLLTATSAQLLYDFGPVASDASLRRADELFVQVTLREPLMYLEGSGNELYVSAFYLVKLCQSLLCDNWLAS